MKNTNFSKACREISQNLLQITEPTKSNAKFEIKRICTKYSLDKIPKNYEILSTVDGKSYEKLQKILLKKPVKTASGVAVIALMPKPYACPHGRCTYCQVELNLILQIAIQEKSLLQLVPLKMDMTQIFRSLQNLTNCEYLDMMQQKLN